MKEGYGGRLGENEIKMGEKKKHIEKQRAQANNAEISRANRKVFKGKHGGFGISQRNNLKIKTPKPDGGGEERLGVNVTISMSGSAGEGNCT